MPLYKFRCDKCNKIFEGMQKLKDFDKPVKCPICQTPLKRQLSPVMFKI